MSVSILRRRLRSKKVKAIVIMVVMNFLILGGASADNNTVSINWTDLGEMISGVGNLMPSIGNLVVAVVPVLFTLIIVGFVTGLLDSIIGAIRDAFRFFR